MASLTRKINAPTALNTIARVNVKKSSKNRTYTIVVDYIYMNHQAGLKYRRLCQNPIIIGFDTPYKVRVNILHPKVARMPRFGPSFPSTYKKEVVNANA